MITSFVVPGHPIPKARPRVTRYGTYTPASTVDYELRVRKAWLAVGGAEFPPDTPLSVTVVANFQIPKSISKRMRILMEGAFHTKHRGDIDNVVKSVLDALNGYAFPDDCIVCVVHCMKRWASEPSTVVTIKTIETEEKENG